MNEREKAWLANQYAEGRLQISLAKELGFTNVAVHRAIKEFIEDWAVDDMTRRKEGYGRHIAAKIAFTNYQKAVGGAVERPTRYRVGVANNDPYWQARLEHAWLLRAEGETPSQIAERLDVPTMRVYQMISVFGARVEKAARNMRVRWQHDAHDRHA
jgi:hypothetical protein